MRIALYVLFFCVPAFAETFALVPSGNDIVDETLRAELDADPAAEIVIRPKVFAIDGHYLIIMEKTRAGKRIAAFRLIAANVGEIEMATQRLARAMTRGHLDAAPGELTAHEARMPQGYSGVLVHAFLGFGPHASLFGYRRPGTMIDLSLGLDIRVSPHLNFGLYYDDSSVIDKGGDLSQLGFYANYFLENQNVAPFLHGAIGYGNFVSDGGYVVDLGAGYAFFRASKVNFEALFHTSYFIGPKGSAGMGGLRLSVQLPLF